MIQNVKAYNRFAKDEDLAKKDNDSLLANCHPLDREDFKSKLNLACE